MKKIKLTDVIRWLLTAIIAAGVYTETGIFTLIFMVLVTVATEIISFSLRKKMVDINIPNSEEWEEAMRKFADEIRVKVERRATRIRNEK